MAAADEVGATAWNPQQRELDCDDNRSTNPDRMAAMLEVADDIIGKGELIQLFPTAEIDSGDSERIIV